MFCALWLQGTVECSEETKENTGRMRKPMRTISEAVGLLEMEIELCRILTRGKGHQRLAKAG